VGGARTALFNWLYARKVGGKFLLRVEDTDKARSTDESTRAIFEGLRWLGLEWDEDVVFQGANVKQHQADAQTLLASGHAYHDSNAIRFRVPEGKTSWDDLVHGTITFPNKDIEDFVILRTDGTPVYNFAVVSDDLAMKITLVLRGDDHISNTPKQIMLYRAFGVALPQFGHLPMIHGADGKKLSKRQGAAAVADWQHVGILPSAMVNFLALLGWSPKNDIELMSLPELIERFDVAGLLKSPSVFDTKKLEWMNGQYMSRATVAELVPHLTPLLAKDGVVPSWFTPEAPRGAAVVDLVKGRSRTTLQLAEQVRVFFERPDLSAIPPAAQKLLDTPLAPTALTAVRDVLTGADGAWTLEVVQALLEPVPAALGAKPGDVFQPLRAALTGSNASPEIYAVVFHVGREEAIARISAALARRR
jgi:glutamyl-tRNA synthetase